MRLTRHTDYAFRVLIYLGLRPGEKATIAEIAERHRISRQHLMKVVQGLVRHGFVRSARGKHGGISLARGADGINLGDVCRQTERDFTLADCFAHSGVTCRIVPECRLAGMLQDGLTAFLGVLDRHTLADLLVNRERLGILLSVPVVFHAPANDA